MLVSIRANSTLPVTIVTNNYPYKEWHLLPDNLIQINPEDCYTNGQLSPAKAKLSLYKYSTYEETIYLDVDGLLFRELDFPVADFMVHVNGFSDLENDNQDVNLWVKPEVVYKKYLIPEENRLPGTNSSFMAWKENGVRVFEQALKNLADPIDINELRYKWGKSDAQPDELYLNVALAQLGILPVHFPVLFTMRRNANKGYVGFEYINANFYAICCWGGLQYNAFEISGTGNIKTGLYNKLMKGYFDVLHGVDTFNDSFYSLITNKIYEKGIR